MIKLESVTRTSLIFDELNVVTLMNAKYQMKLLMRTGTMIENLAYCFAISGTVQRALAKSNVEIHNMLVK